MQVRAVAFVLFTAMAKPIEKDAVLIAFLQRTSLPHFGQGVHTTMFSRAVKENAYSNFPSYAIIAYASKQMQRYG